MHLFGRGLVESPDNFGFLGERADATPNCSTTWPRKFVADGWSIKKLIRRLVLSRDLPAGQRRTTRPATRPTRTTRSCGGCQPRRLDAEAIRDAMLARQRQARPDPARPAPLADDPGNARRPPTDRGDDPHRSVYLGIVRDDAAAGDADACSTSPTPTCRRPARGDHGAGPGAVPDEQPVRRRAGAGSWPNGCCDAPGPGRRRPGRPGLPPGARPARRPSARAAAAVLAFLRAPASRERRALGRLLPGAARRRPNSATCR